MSILSILSEKKIQKLIYPVGFYPTKAKRLLEISRILLDRYGGRVPDDLEELTALPGVGRKTANLVLVEGFKIPAICVDTHVHRISNRIGYVKTKNPDKTELALRKKLPRRHWVRYNELLVAFGVQVNGKTDMGDILVSFHQGDIEVSTSESRVAWQTADLRLRELESRLEAAFYSSSSGR